MVVAAILFGNEKILGQVLPDNSFETQVESVDGLSFKVRGGAQVGRNLFHSFKGLSISEDGSLNFEDSGDIDRIVVRVTGHSSSDINGLIKTRNLVDLFLLNPNGIKFGKRASLEIGGSFFVSTAENLKFTDNSLFSTNLEFISTLSPSLPSGFLMGFRSMPITIQGNGQGVESGPGIPATRVGFRDGPELKLNSGKTFAIIGAGIDLNNTVLTVPGGQIFLASIKQGSINFDSLHNNDPSIFLKAISLSDTAIAELLDIQISQNSLIDVSGDGGLISVLGKNVHLVDASKIINQNQSERNSSGIYINATQMLEVSSTSSRNLKYPGDGEPNRTPVILSESLGQGNAGNIKILTRNLAIKNGGAVVSASFSETQAGDVEIVSSGLLQVLGGLSPLEPSIITSQTYSSAQSGNIIISAPKVETADGGRITSSSFGSGNAGQVEITASDQINVIGTLPDDKASQSGISSNSFRSGNSGDVIINTGKLRVSDGGDIVTAAYAEGNAGNLTINATDSIEINGIATGVSPFSPDPVNNPSLISSAAESPDPGFRAVFGLPDKPSGRAGSVTLNTPKLTIRNGGQVTVANDGNNGAGDINITANQLVLRNQGAIKATTASGQGGNINLDIEDIISLIGNSNIDTSAEGPGNGGNINIDTGFIVAPLYQDNNILAKAVFGNGGNIDVTVLNLFGIYPADEDLPDRNDINASSEYGQDGTVTLNNANLDPTRGLFESRNRVDLEKQIGPSCFDAQGRALLDNVRIRIIPDISSFTRYRELTRVFKTPFLTYDVPPTLDVPPDERLPIPVLAMEADSTYKLADGTVLLRRTCTASGPEPS